MRKSTKIIVNTSKIYKNKTIVGLHDGDGTHTIRVLHRINNNIGWTVLSSFGQSTKNVDVLEPVQATLGGCMTSYVDNKGRKSSRLDVNFNTPAGATWLKILKRYKPRVPGKRRDYLIAEKVSTFAKTRTLPGLDNICKNNNLRSDKVGNVAALILTYKMTNESQRDPSSVQRKKVKTFYYWIQHLKPTVQEFKYGKILARNLLAAIELEENQLRYSLTQNKCKLSNDYIVGYFIADGSLTISIDLKAPFKNFSAEPEFTVKECAYSKDILQAFLYKFGGGSVISDSKRDAYAFYKLTGWGRNLELIVPIFSRYALPKSRQVQFKAFSKACHMAVKGQHLTRSGFERFLKIVWPMCDDGIHRETPEHVMLANAQKYFDHQEARATLRTSYHSMLRKKYVTSKGNIRNVPWKPKL